MFLVLVDHQKIIKELPEKTKDSNGFVARDNQLCHKNAWFNRLGTNIYIYIYIFFFFFAVHFFRFSRNRFQVELLVLLRV